MNQSPDRGPKRLPRTVAVIAVMVAATACSVWWMRSCARLPGDMAAEVGRRLAEGLRETLQLQPEVKIDRVTVLGPGAPAAEYVSAKREFTHDYKWEHQWLGSTKKLRLRGVFLASAGFDLRERFAVDIDPRDLSVALEIPEPRILGVEMRRYTADEEQGYWNWLGADEREGAVNALLASARKAAADEAPLLEEARREFVGRIAQVVRDSGGRLKTLNGRTLEAKP